jgi:hypothetical protein
LPAVEGLIVPKEYVKGASSAMISAQQ